MISLIVSVYNVEKYLHECLNSIYCQTFKDFEAILVDDESKDLSNEICSEFVKKDKRFKLFRINHSGLAAGRKFGFQNSDGDYISFIDGDDWLEPTYCEKLILEFQKKKNVDIVVCDFFENNLPKNNWNYKVFAGKRDIFSGYIDNQIYNRMWNKMYTRDIVAKIDFSNGRDQFEDGFWMPQAMAKSDKIIRIPDCLYHYRIREGSLMKKKKSSKEIADEFVNSFGRIDILLENHKVIGSDYAIDEYNKKIVAIVNTGYNVEKYDVLSMMKEITIKHKKILCKKSYLFPVLYHANNKKDFYHLYWKSKIIEKGFFKCFSEYIKYNIHVIWRLFDKN